MDGSKPADIPVTCTILHIPAAPPRDSSRPYRGWSWSVCPPVSVFPAVGHGRLPIAQRVSVQSESANEGIPDLSTEMDI